MSRMLIVFKNSSIRWLRFILKNNFSHCYCIVETDNGIIQYEIIYGNLVCQLLPGSFENLQKELYERNNNLLEDTVDNFPKSAFSCVQLIKNMLGIKKLLIFTPWQLCKYLVSK